MRNASIDQFVKLRRQLSDERGALEARLQEINQALGEMPLPSLSPIAGAAGRRGRPGLSAGGRAKIAAAQRARWAKLKGGTAAQSPAAAPSRKRRRMSPAARKAIAEAAKRRWAAARAAGKNRL